MEANNKFVLYDAYVFAFKNALAHVRIFTLAFFTFFAVTLPIALSILFITKSLPAVLSGAALTKEYWQAWIISNFATSFGIGLILVTIILLLLSWIVMTIVRISLAIHDTGTAGFKEIVPDLFILIKVFFGTLIHFFVMILGFICFIIPGIYWIIRSWFYLYAIIEGRGIMQAFSTSFSLTKNKEWYIFTQLVASGALGSAIAFLAAPIVILSNTYLYRELSKESK